MNNVIVYENVIVKKACPDTEWKNIYERKEDYTGQFITHGVSYEELEHGVGQYSTFIVRKENGDIENVPVEHCKLIGDIT